MNPDQQKDNFSFREFTQAPVTVKKITKREGFYFFYAGLDPRLKLTYKPYELVKLVNSKDPSIARLAILESAKGLNGLELSDILAHNLKVQEGDSVYVESIQPVPGVTQILISKINTDVPTLNDEGHYNRYNDTIDEDPLDYLSYDKSEKRNLDLRTYVKKTFSYSYVSDGHEFCFDNHWYRINTDENKKIKHFLILPTTKIKIQTDTEILDTRSIIGLEEPYQAIKEAITWPTLYAPDYKRLNIEPSKGILLTGPPGCGKTHLVREMSKNTDMHFIHIKGPEIISNYVGGSEKELRKIFETAKKNQPSIIFFDEIDAIGGKRSTHSQNESRIVAQLLTLMDGLVKRGNITVIAATNKPNLLDESLRRPGRFDKQITIKPPKLEDRKKLFELFLNDLAKSKNLDLGLLAEKTPGFVQADIKHLVNDAKVNVIRRKEQNKNASDRDFFLTMEDFETSLKNMDPSLLRQHTSIKERKKTLDNIIGYEAIKTRLFDEICMPTKYPHLFKNFNLKKTKGILLQGPPGTGKTTLAKALASELNYNFISISASDINSMYVGQSEQKIREIFNKAALSAPTILFFDEIDSIFSSSDSIKNVATHDVSKIGQLLTEMDGALTTKDDIILIGTTNKTRYLDPALLRPGRFELILTMDYPNLDELDKLYKYYFKDITNITDFSTIVNRSRLLNFTGADIEAIKKNATCNYLKEMNPVDLRALELQSSTELKMINITEDKIHQSIDDLIARRIKKSNRIDTTN